MRLLLLSALFLAGCGGGGSLPTPAPGPTPTPPTLVQVINTSGIPESSVALFVAQANAQLSNEFAQAWHVNAQVSTSPGWGTLYLLPSLPSDAPANAAAYHAGAVDYVGLHESGGLWPVSGTHELMEQLSGRECCDPVQAFSYYHAGSAMAVSDFVFPNYYVPGSAGPWDYMGVVTAPLTPAPGGS